MLRLPGVCRVAPRAALPLVRAVRPTAGPIGQPRIVRSLVRSFADEAKPAARGRGRPKKAIEVSETAVAVTPRTIKIKTSSAKKESKETEVQPAPVKEEQKVDDAAQTKRKRSSSPRKKGVDETPKPAGAQPPRELADILESAVQKDAEKKDGKRKTKTKDQKVEKRKAVVADAKKPAAEEKELTETDLTPQERVIAAALERAVESAKKQKEMADAKGKAGDVVPKKPREPLTKEQEGFSKAFAELGIDKRLADGLAHLGMKEPFPIQRIGVPDLLKGGDVILSAETGTGKTFTYLLPIMQRLVEAEKEPGYDMMIKEKHTRAIILVPNRDLGAQVNTAAVSLARAAEWRLITAEVLPGQKVDRQAKQLRRAPDITVATPARLVQHRAEKAIMYNDVEWVVLDEVDTLLQEGFVEHLDRILQPILGIRQGRKGARPLNFVFVSATVSKEVLRSIQKNFPGARTLFTETVGTVSSKVKHEFLPMSRDDEKLSQLLEIMKSEKKDSRSLIFCNTVGRCTRVRNTLVDAGFPSECFHGGLKPKTAPLARFRNLAAMHKGDLRALVATEIASRGLDTLNVSSVINYDCPLDAQEYLRKAGRTGRAGKEGHAVTYYLPGEKPLADAIEAAIKNGAQLSTVRQKIAKQVAPPPPKKGIEEKPKGPPMPGAGNKKKYWGKAPTFDRNSRRGARPPHRGSSPRPMQRGDEEGGFKEDSGQRGNRPERGGRKNSDFRRRDERGSEGKRDSDRPRPQRFDRDDRQRSGGQREWQQQSNRDNRSAERGARNFDKV